MKISIIIPTRNRAKNLDCVLTSIFNNKTDYEFEVIVVDDRSEDNTKEIADKYPQVRYFKVDGTHNSWNASIPRNLGVKMASGDLLWFLDSDVVIPPDAIQETYKAFTKGNIARILIGSYHWLPAQTVTSDDVKNRWEDLKEGRLPFLHIERKGMLNMKDIRQVSFDKAANSQQEFYSFTDSLACFGGYLLMTKQTFWAAGGYDESMLAGVEDGDFGITLFEMGAKFSYLKEVCGYHIAHEQPSGRDNNIIAAQVIRLNEKHHVDMIHESGKAYRRWGIDWTPPSTFYGGDPRKLEEYKKSWETDKLDFMMKINKVDDKGNKVE
jgi:glycosyltransferase involved in cell wall biosynthesis